MKWNIKSKSIIVEIICLLFVMLFIYAAVSKVLEFDHFQVQLGQSPLLSAFASWISWVVPSVEILIAVILLLPQLRNIGLAASLSLMTMFTAYIFIVLHYSSFVPCSCGGILEKMSWNVHLIFNLVFVLFAVIAIILNGKNLYKAHFKIRYFNFKLIFSIIVLSVVAVAVLFLSSEDIIHQRNPFVRRYPPHPTVFVKLEDLKVNSYYFAGYSRSRLYLGNKSNPLHVLSMDANLENQEARTIIFDPKKIPFRAVVISVKDDNFFLSDGTVPKIFRGTLVDWKVNKELTGIPHFTLAIPIDSSTIVYRSNIGKNAVNVLGIFNNNGKPKIKQNKELLQQQVDGIFDTDGTLLYNEQLQKMVYLYYYRNEFVVADQQSVLKYRGKTIDTIKHAKIKVATLDNGKQHVMSAPPFVVNSSASVYGNLLFVHSRVKGKYDSEKVWKNSFIIDVYDLTKKTYLMSFPVYRTGDNSLNSILATDKYFFALIGKHLVVYEIEEILRKEMTILKE
ncbi:MauE/DoxX family redox-associated membrane protein [Flavobacterium sp. HJSW_4]|uniref:MauE/DoxX family redox-associated membrane protein n=1 Tax=Flavobacterium sp. HJSW_4 TaxID=3344660 RepID=UPI0035F3524C